MTPEPDVFADLAAIAAVLVALALYPSRAAVLVALNYAALWAVVYLCFVKSPHWNVDFLDEYHLFCALFNTVFVILITILAGQYRLVVISGALVALLNLSVYFATRNGLDTAAARFAVDYFGTVRLALVSLQIVGLCNAVGPDRKNGKRRRVRPVLVSVGRTRHRFVILYPKVYK